MVLPLLQNYVFKPKFTHRRWEQVQIGNADTYQHPLRQTCSPLLSLSQALTSPRACAAGSVQRKTWETLNLTEFNWAKKWFRNQGSVPSELWGSTTAVLPLNLFLSWPRSTDARLPIKQHMRVWRKHTSVRKSDQRLHRNHRDADKPTIPGCEIPPFPWATT